MPAGNRRLARALDDLVSGARKALVDPKSAAVKSVLGLLGPVGRAISTAIDARHQSGFVTTAAKSVNRVRDLINQLSGEDTATPEERGGQLIPGPPRPNVILPTENRPPAGPFIPQQESGLPPGVTTDGRVLHIQTGGYNRKIPVSDPIVTGKMLRVNSSNVHSIGFQLNLKMPSASKLIVRYLAAATGQQRRTRPGPTYAYDNCGPDLFNFMKRAASKGGFVWDNLRIRGSRVAHRHTYKLIGVAGGYVPRRATVKNGREMFVQRSVRTGRGNVLRSKLPTVVLGRIKPGIARLNVNGR